LTGAESLKHWKNSGRKRLKAQPDGILMTLASTSHALSTIKLAELVGH